MDAAPWCTELAGVAELTSFFRLEKNFKARASTVARAETRGKSEGGLCAASHTVTLQVAQPHTACSCTYRGSTMSSITSGEPS